MEERLSSGQISGVLWCKLEEKVELFIGKNKSRYSKSDNTLKTQKQFEDNMQLCTV
jgi:hypothetical protein